jgi:hypothetical protein
MGMVMIRGKGLTSEGDINRLTSYGAIHPPPQLPEDHRGWGACRALG